MSTKLLAFLPLSPSFCLCIFIITGEQELQPEKLASGENKLII